MDIDCADCAVRTEFYLPVYNAQYSHQEFEKLTDSLIDFYRQSLLLLLGATALGGPLASSTIRLHWSLFLAFSIHPLIPILLRSAITSSSHLILGLSILLVAYSFPFSTLLGMAVSSILSTWSSHYILWAFVNLTILSTKHNTAMPTEARVPLDCFIVKWGWVGPSKHNCHKIVFYWLDGDYMFRPRLAIFRS